MRRAIGGGRRNSGYASCRYCISDRRVICIRFDAKLRCIDSFRRRWRGNHARRWCIRTGCSSGGSIRIAVRVRCHIGRGNSRAGGGCWGIRVIGLSGRHRGRGGYRSVSHISGLLLEWVLHTRGDVWSVRGRCRLRRSARILLVGSSRVGRISRRIWIVA